MTLNSNKNEPAVILERVNSARTALSDLYLEQLLQNKPKSDKVRRFAEQTTDLTITEDDSWSYFSVYMWQSDVDGVCRWFLISVTDIRVSHAREG